MEEAVLRRDFQTFAKLTMQVQLDCTHMQNGVHLYDSNIIYTFLAVHFVASFPGLPCFYSLVCVQYNTWKWFAALPLPCIILNTNRSTKRGRPGNEANILYLLLEARNELCDVF